MLRICYNTADGSLRIETHYILYLVIKYIQ